MAAAAALGAAFGEGSQVPGAPASSPAGALGSPGRGLLSSWKLWVRAWLHVPGKKGSELASEPEASPSLERGSSASGGVAPAPAFPLAELSSDCILRASRLCSSSRLSLEAQASSMPLSFPSPSSLGGNRRAFCMECLSRLRWQRQGSARPRCLSCTPQGLPETRLGLPAPTWAHYCTVA